MQIKAKLNYLRIAPRKVRLVADMIHKKKVEEAQAILNFTIKRASQPLLKLLNSALANAKNEFQLEPSNLYISKITVDEGPKLKRWRARARGRAMEIQKKTSHITLVLEEIKPIKKKKPEKIKEAAEEKKKSPVIKKETTVESRPKGARLASGKLPEAAIPEEKKDKGLEVKKPKWREKIGLPKPKERGGIRRFFRRKSF